MKNNNRFTDESTSPKFAPGPDDCSNLWDDPLAFLQSAVEKHGDIVCLDNGVGQVYLLNHPDYIKHVMLDNHRNYRKTEDQLKPLVGNGMVVSDGDFWLRQRRIMQPSFHRQRIGMMIPVMVDVVTKFIERWETIEEPIDLLAEMTELTIQLSAKTMFSVDIDTEETQKLADVVSKTMAYINNSNIGENDEETQPESPEKLAFDESLGTLNQIIYRIINQRRESGEDKNDLLSLLLQAKDEQTGEGMTNQQLRDEIVTLWLAGQSTTATTLTWIWHLIATHPDAEHKLHQELKNILGDEPPTMDSIRLLEYTRMVIEETMRLYPIFWLILRRCVSADKIGGYDIPANALIYISTYLIHRHPNFWKEPDRFDPERHSTDRAANRTSFTYIPFGGGPHTCIGNNFAVATMQIILATISKQYYLRHTEKSTVIPQPEIFLMPQNRLTMVLHHL